MQFEKKNISVFLCFFRIKILGLQKKKTLKKFFFSKYSFKRNYKLTVA